MADLRLPLEGNLLLDEHQLLLRLGHVEEQPLFLFLESDDRLEGEGEGWS